MSSPRYIDDVTPGDLIIAAEPVPALGTNHLSDLARAFADEWGIPAGTPMPAVDAGETLFVVAVHPLRRGQAMFIAISTRDPSMQFNLMGSRSVKFTRLETGSR